MLRILKRIHIRSGHKKILGIGDFRHWLFTLIKKISTKTQLFLCPDQIWILRKKISSVQVLDFWKNVFLIRELDLRTSANYG